MLETIVQGNDWLTFIQPLEGDEGSHSGAVAPTSFRKHQASEEAWEKTDRPLTVPRPGSSASVRNDAHTVVIEPQSTQARWLADHDVHTEFLDAGIGCCWYAYQGDDEPVCGETEQAALEKLARQHGVESSPT